MSLKSMLLEQIMSCIILMLAHHVALESKRKEISYLISNDS